MRHTHDPRSSSDQAPFLDLLKSAHDVEVRELSSREAVPQLERALREFESNEESGTKTFFVTVRVDPPRSKAENRDLTENYLLQNAKLLLEEKEFILARNLFSFVLKKNLKEPQALRGLGICLSRLGQTASAKKCFRALWELYQESDALLELGMCYIAERQDDLALTYLKKIPETNSLPHESKFDLYKEMGNCQTRRGLLNEAEASYRKALEIVPSSDVIYVNLGTLNIQRNRLEDALDSFRQAIELNPKNAKAFCGIGLIAQQKGQGGVAVDAFNKTLDLDPMNVVALFQLVSLSDSLGDDIKLKGRLENFLLSDPKNHEVRYALAVILFKEGQWAQCEREVETLLKIDPYHAKSRTLKAELASTKIQLKLR